jgi:hypothetical protein
VLKDFECLYNVHLFIFIYFGVVQHKFIGDKDVVLPPFNPSV